ncbi:MAG: hypothetical protein H6603_11210 [Flavobacteriales bacterium]|nr:hypothetical protein [Flavobacteriales bacterium]
MKSVVMSGVFLFSMCLGIIGYANPCKAQHTMTDDCVKKIRRSFPNKLVLAINWREEFAASGDKNMIAELVNDYCGAFLDTTKQPCLVGLGKETVHCLFGEPDNSGTNSSELDFEEYDAGTEISLSSRGQEQEELKRVLILYYNHSADTVIRQLLH